MGNINKKVDKLIAKRQWDKLLHNLGETNGDSKMKIAKACGVSGGSGCIDLLSVILNDREASDDLLLETIDSLAKSATTGASRSCGTSGRMWTSPRRP